MPAMVNRGVNQILDAQDQAADTGGSPFRYRLRSGCLGDPMDGLAEGAADATRMPPAEARVSAPAAIRITVTGAQSRHCARPLRAAAAKARQRLPPTHARHQRR